MSKAAARSEFLSKYRDEKLRYRTECAGAILQRFISPLVEERNGVGGTDCRVVERMRNPIESPR